MMDAGDMPLLRAPSETTRSRPAFVDQGSYDDGMGMGAGGMPGGMGDGSSMYGQEDDMETNIRYGRIPQRVPRRYKTIKKVE